MSGEVETSPKDQRFLDFVRNDKARVNGDKPDREHQQL
jgi:hypothetical protein